MSPVPPLRTRPALATPFLSPPGGGVGLLQLGLAPFLLLCFPLFLCLSRRDSPCIGYGICPPSPAVAVVTQGCDRSRLKSSNSPPSLPLSPSLPFDSAYWRSQRQTRKIRKGQLLIDDESRKLGFTPESCNGSGVFTVFTDGAFRCSRLWGF